MWVGIVLVLLAVIGVILQSKSKWGGDEIRNSHSLYDGDKPSRLLEGKSEKSRMHQATPGENDPVRETTNAGETFNLIADDGAITSEALKLAGLRPEDAIKIKKIIELAWRETAEEMKARAVVLTGNEDDPSVTIDIGADQASGDAQIAKLGYRLKIEFGEHASRKLLLGLNSWKYFGDFGRMDIRLTFGPDPDALSMSPEDVALYGLGGEVMQMKFFDPKSGELKSSARYTSKDKMIRYMGNLVDFANEEYLSGRGASGD
jgi:hypothetical protein